MSELELEADHGASAEREAGDLVYPFGPIPERGETLRIADGIHWLRMPLPYSFDINLYLLEDEDGWNIVDTGLYSSVSREVWERVFDGILKGKPVKRVVVTHMHPDHVGCAGWLVERTGAEFWMTRTDFLAARHIKATGSETVPEFVLDFYRRAGLPGPAIEMIRAHGYNNFSKAVADLPDSYHRLKDGATIEMAGRKWSITCGHGHAPEHAILESEDGFLLAGDMLIPRISSNVSVYPNEPHGDPLVEWLLSQQRIGGMRADMTVLPAHNEPFRGLRPRVNQLLDGHVRKLAAIFDVLEKGPQTATAITPQVYRRELKGVDFILALGESLAHIHHLEVLGYVRREAGEGGDLFHRTGAFDRAAHRHLQEVQS